MFFALWPDDLVRDQISRNLKSLNLEAGETRFIDSRNLHLTLHFIGNTSFAEMKCLDQQASLTRSSSFELVLDGSGYFRKPRVFWFGCRKPPKALFELQRSLGYQLNACAFMPEERPYSPHVTVARKLATAPEVKSLTPINWRIERFVLVKSTSIPTGVCYEVVESYALE